MSKQTQMNSDVNQEINNPNISESSQEQTTPNSEEEKTGSFLALLTFLLFPFAGVYAIVNSRISGMLYQLAKKEEHQEKKEQLRGMADDYSSSVVGYFATSCVVLLFVVVFLVCYFFEK